MNSLIAAIVRGKALSDAGVLGRWAGGGRARAPASDNAFPRTIAAINEFKVAHPEAKIEIAHLTVLEGMAHLQSGQIGRAKLMRDEVRTAAPLLHSGNDRFTRDEMLARAYDPLLVGWEQVSFARPSSSINPSSASFKDAASGIESTLRGLDSSRVAAPELDAGAKYLATSAGVFRVWVGNLQPTEKAAERQKGAVLLERFLTPAEKQAAETGQFSGLAPNQEAYTRWFRFLKTPVP